MLFAMERSGKRTNMEIKEAIKNRHSVRQYRDIPLEDSLVTRLKETIEECNQESGLKIQLVLDDPECFDAFLAHTMKFQNVRNYLVIAGEKGMPDLEEKGGYFGQRIVLEAQRMGLNTCWVGGTYKKGKCKAVLSPDEKILCVIAVGYGANEGKKHRSKPLDKVCGVKKEEMPAWFRDGMKAALMAPTALNQQKFFVTLKGDRAVIRAGKGPMAKIDLGIVRYNFEAASGHECSRP